MSTPLTIALPPIFDASFPPVLSRIRTALTRYFSDLSADDRISENASDEAVMTAYRNGNRQAFRTLFDRYAQGIHASALKRGFSQADAADAVQQTFIHVHQGRNEFRKGAAVRPWIYTIAFNVMRDMGRRVSSQSRLKDRYAAEPKHDETQADAPSTQGASRLRNALETLSPPQREVLVLHYFEEMSFRDIAALIGAGEGAVRVRAHRAYVKLREALSLANIAGDPT